MKMSELFAAAKKKLLRADELEEARLRCLNKRTYICYAIGDTRAPKALKEEAEELIMTRLEVYPFLESWVQNKIGDKAHWAWFAKHSTQEYREKMQATRHAWLDSLIAEFAAKGN